METPSPAMKIPVCPVARKSAFRPRRFISFSSASVVYILPTEQSVPTASRRLPGRLAPVPTSNSRVGWRTSKSWRPSRRAASLSFRDIGRAAMQAAGEIHAQLQRLDQGLGPTAADHAAAIGDADDDRLHPRGLGLLQGHVRDFQIGLAARQAQLARAPIGAPVNDALGRLGRKLIMRLAEEHQIGMRNRHVEPNLKSRGCKNPAAY